MIISHTHRFIMLLPWKTASQTLRARLAAFDENPAPPSFHFDPHLNRIVHQHLSCADLRALPASRLGYVTASFVRNPYDRAWSGFQQLQRDIAAAGQLTFSTPWIRSLVMQQQAENRQQLLAAQHDFDRWIQLLREEQIFEQGRNTSFPLHPAHYWTHVADEQAVDFIGKVEHFEQDFGAFLRLLQLEDLPRLNANVTELEARSRLGPADYRYTDRMRPASIARINALFATDFERFGYARIEP